MKKSPNEIKSTNRDVHLSEQIRLGLLRFIPSACKSGYSWLAVFGLVRVLSRKRHLATPLDTAYSAYLKATKCRQKVHSSRCQTHHACCFASPDCCDCQQQQV